MFFLTIISSFLSWIISHYYYNKANKTKIEEVKTENLKTLKTYATKAAEKVKNLSVQLVGLTTYLNEELSSDDYSSLEENLMAKEERIKSAIHIINTLKSINDGSLSDWSGVIPDEIKEIKEERLEFMDELRELVDDVKDLKAEQATMYAGSSPHSENSQTLKLLDVNKKLDLLLTSLTGVTPNTRRRATKREDVTKNCPVCSENISYNQKPTKVSKKQITCSSCGVRLVSSWNPNDKFVLDTKKNFDINSIGKDLLDEIRKKLPEQPWPKGTSLKISSELGISSSQTEKAINILIKRGEFKYQVDGKLFDSQSNKKIQKAPMPLFDY